MWEYRMIFAEYRLFSELTNELNKEGEENWEIIYFYEEKPEKYNSKYQAKVLFKRQKQ